MISLISVSDANIDVSEDDEEVVFSNLKYWKDMPVIESAPKYFNAIRDRLGYDLYVFTSRNWKIKESDINQVTLDWLQKYDFKSQKVIIEKDKTCKIYSSGLINKLKDKLNCVVTGNDRISLCSKYKVKYFIEDNLQNALKLSNTCMFVFLIDRKYNQSQHLPYNVIRINSWKDIFNKIKELG